MFIGKHPAHYFDIIYIVTPLVLESSTSVPVCRREIPSRHVFSWVIVSNIQSLIDDDHTPDLESSNQKVTITGTISYYFLAFCLGF